MLIHLYSAKEVKMKTNYEEIIINFSTLAYVLVKKKTNVIRKKSYFFP